MRRFKVFLEQVPQNFSPEQVELHLGLCWRLPPGKGDEQGRAGAPGNIHSVSVPSDYEWERGWQ